ncbi:MAG: hypothetical protein WCO95_02735 [Actinomycetes bacterium]
MPLRSRHSRSLWESTLVRRTSKGSALITAGILIAGTVGLSACGAAIYSENSGLPNTKLTPGAVNPLVTQGNIRSTICVSGWTATVRPPVSYTNKLKYDQLHSGYNLNGDLTMKNYEEDHIVPLEVGGHPSSPLNLFPQPRNIKFSAYLKDQLENRIHQLVCTGQLTLKVGQSIFLTNWEKGYTKYVGPLP